MEERAATVLTAWRIVFASAVGDTPFHYGQYLRREQPLPRRDIYLCGGLAIFKSSFRRGLFRSDNRLFLHDPGPGMHLLHPIRLT